MTIRKITKMIIIKIVKDNPKIQLDNAVKREKKEKKKKVKKKEETSPNLAINLGRAVWDVLLPRTFWFCISTVRDNVKGATR